MKMKTTDESNGIVLKTERGYFLDAYESYNFERENFDFTYDPEKAYDFYDSSDVPKYMWNNIEQKTIDSVAELCEFLNGNLVKITTTKTVEHREEEFNLSDLRVIE